MAERYRLTPSDVAALRALYKENVESLPSEVAVRSLLPTNRVRSALNRLQQSGLVRSSVSAIAERREPLFELTTEGRAVSHMLNTNQTAPVVGAMLAMHPGMIGGAIGALVGGLIGGVMGGLREPALVEIVPEEEPQVARE